MPKFAVASGIGKTVPTFKEYSAAAFVEITGTNSAGRSPKSRTVSEVLSDDERFKVAVKFISRDIALMYAENESLLFRLFSESV